ncbi:uncharacterized protein LOC100145473 isoform X3 [Xenopus tropicalis]|uniref:Uncharacterized protein LOC100145473 isoform X3 n=1 Tax=Xenopus tropicalis TaxID=8364 RepID=A0A8J1J3B6_XENTR|nr:uncharacterized protein LOC100145473 isoform X3 [Xenopus tropicalis]
MVQLLALLQCERIHKILHYYNMPTCIVNGCHHSCKKKKSFPNVVLHVFPGNIDTINKWLQNIPQDFGDIDEMAQKILLRKKTDADRICSDHFAPDCYVYQGTKRVLKLDAVPTIFPKKTLSTSTPCRRSARQLKQQNTTVTESVTEGGESDMSLEKSNQESTKVSSAMTSFARVSELQETETSSQRTSFSIQVSNSGLQTSSSSQSRPTDITRNPLHVDTGMNTDCWVNCHNQGTMTNPKFGTRSIKIQSNVITSNKFIQCERITTSKQSSVLPSSSHDFVMHLTPITILPPEQSIALLFPTTISEKPGHSLQLYERQSLDFATNSIARDWCGSCSRRFGWIIQPIKSEFSRAKNGGRSR